MPNTGTDLLSRQPESSLPFRHTVITHPFKTATLILFYSNTTRHHYAFSPATCPTPDFDNYSHHSPFRDLGCHSPFSTAAGITPIFWQLQSLFTLSDSNTHRSPFSTATVATTPFGQLQLPLPHFDSYSHYLPFPHPMTTVIRLAADCHSRLDLHFNRINGDCGN